jgi:phenylpropionate dioxygenase-like ring-hydroxylating dioxygenase large terminal subunit
MGRATHFRCSYHGWTFANTGELRGVPSIKDTYADDFDRADFSLFQPAQVATHSGFVFAYWDDGGPSLDDYLGDFGWYLHALFGKSEMEVLGPPVRGVVRTNWKLGADNYVGDGYHLPTTHKTVVDMGMLEGLPAGSGRSGNGIDMESILATGHLSERQTTHCISTEHGHGIRVQRLPLEFERPTFIGYPEVLWDGFAKRLDDGQIDMQSGLTVAHGNIFPNCSFIEALAPHTGKGTDPTAYLHIRQWQPLGPDSTILWSWGLVPHDSSEEWRRGSQRALLRHLGFAGSVETDDFQNLVSSMASNRGPMAWNHTYDYHATGNPRGTTPSVDWPGDVAPVNYGEMNQLALLRRWSELMDDEGDQR